MKNKLYEAPKISVDVIFLEESLAASSVIAEEDYLQFDQDVNLYEYEELTEESNEFYIN